MHCGCAPARSTETKDTPDAPEAARKELAKLGPMSRDEKITAAAFLLTVGLWIGGASLGVNSVAAAIVGLSILLITGACPPPPHRHPREDATLPSRTFAIQYSSGNPPRCVKLAHPPPAASKPLRPPLPRAAPLRLQASCPGRSAWPTTRRGTR